MSSYQYETAYYEHLHGKLQSTLQPELDCWGWAWLSLRMQPELTLRMAETT